MAVANSPIPSPAQRHVQRLFPRSTTIAGPNGQFQGLAQLNPENALVFWLSGYTQNPISPLLPSNERMKLYDFDQTRLIVGSYRAAGIKDAPYIYIDSSAYIDPSDSTRTRSNRINGRYEALRQPNPSTNYTNTSLAFSDANQPFLNPDTFQIQFAGLDGILGNDDDLSNCWSGTRKQYLDSLKQ
jgi:hypothetical protein